MRTSAWLRLVGIAGGAAMAAVVACSSNDAPTDKYPSVDSYCEALAGAQCQEAAYCEVDASSCKAVRKPACLAASDKAKAAGRTYTPAKAPACVDAATKTWGTNNVSPTDETATLDTCARVFQGSVDKNGACTDDLQCAGDRVCDKQHCGDKVVKKSGDGCANIGEVCDTGFYCTGSPALCTPELTLNQPCNATAPCAETLRCVSGTCAPRAEIGGSCAVDTDCNSSFCDNYNGFKCGKAIVFAPAEAVLCGEYGGVPTDGGSAPIVVPDSGTGADAASE